MIYLSILNGLSPDSEGVSFLDFVKNEAGECR